jgi:hypothetical protein
LENNDTIVVYNLCLFINVYFIPPTYAPSNLPIISKDEKTPEINQYFKNPKHFKGIRRLRGNANNRNQKPSKEIWEKEGFK